MTATGRRPRGRPPTGKSPHLRVRVPEPIQEQLRLAAEARGETVTALVLRALERELRKARRETPWQDGDRS